MAQFLAKRRKHSSLGVDVGLDGNIFLTLFAIWARDSFSSQSAIIPKFPP